MKSKYFLIPQVVEQKVDFSSLDTDSQCKNINLLFKKIDYLSQEIGLQTQIINNQTEDIAFQTNEIEHLVAENMEITYTLLEMNQKLSTILRDGNNI